MCCRALTCNMKILVWLFILIMCWEKKKKKSLTFSLLTVLLSRFGSFGVKGVTGYLATIFNFYYFLIGKNSILLIKKENLCSQWWTQMDHAKRVRTNKDFNQFKEHSISLNERWFHSFQIIHIKQPSTLIWGRKPVKHLLDKPLPYQYLDWAKKMTTNMMAIMAGNQSNKILIFG